MMPKIRSKNTAPKIKLQQALEGQGLIISTTVTALPGKPDIVIPSGRLAIFIDGDYWHGNQWRKRKLRALEEQFSDTPSKAYWLRKIRGNMERDCAATAALLGRGWMVLRFWESDIESKLEECVSMLLEALKAPMAFHPASLLPRKTVAEFFAGAGLMRLGLERQGWSIRFATVPEWGNDEMYVERFADEEPLFLLEDINHLSAEDVPAVTLATVSLSSPDLLRVGEGNKSTEPHPSTLWGFINVLQGMEERKPPLVLLSIEAEVLTAPQAEDLREVLEDLNRLGYTIDVFLMDSTRWKWFFAVGALVGEGKLGEGGEEIHFGECNLRPKELSDFILKYPKIRWRLRDLPLPPVSLGQTSLEIEETYTSVIEWIAAHYLNPLVNELIRGRVLRWQGPVL